MTIIQSGNSSPGNANVDAGYNAKVALSDVTAPNLAGVALNFSENDPGNVTGTRSMLSPEVDPDYRVRVALDTSMDVETFDYTAQNTGKHNYSNTTMTVVWTTGGLQTNGSSITTTTTGITFGTYAMFPMNAPGALYFEAEGAFSAQPVANTLIDFGGFLRGAATPYAPLDGVYFRLTAAGLSGVINHNGTETTTSVFAFSYVNSTVYRFVAKANSGNTEFWINDVLYGSIPTPVGQGQPFMSAALPFSVRHAIAGGAAGGVIQFNLRNYNVSVGGLQISDSLSTIANRQFGTYQGLSGGTMGSLANYANSANPGAAVPTNTTAALGTGLGGQFWETDTLAATTDGVIQSYQVPAGTVSVPGKRLVISGVWIDSHVQAACTGGPYVASWCLAFGHTAVSLATAEAATTKAPRRIPLGWQAVGTNAAVATVLTRIYVPLAKPIYVNPGEFVQVVKKKVGTTNSAGTIAHLVGFDYGWE